MGATLTNNSTLSIGGTKLVQEKEYYEKNLEVMLRQEEGSLAQFFEQDTQPYNTGTTFTYRKMHFIRKSGDLTLQEGIVPDPSTVGFKEYKGVLNEYADYVTYTREIKKYAIDDNLVDDMTRLLVDDANYLFNQKRMAAMCSSRNRWFAGVSNPTDIATARAAAKGFDLDELIKIKSRFKKLKVKPLIDGCYPVLISPEIEADALTLKKDNDKYTFVELIKQNSQSDKLLKGEIGRFMGFIFISSDYIIEKDGVHQCIILGKYNEQKPLRERKIGGKGLEVITKDLGSSGTNDPVNQIGSVGWVQDAIGWVVSAPMACLVYECKPTVTYSKVYPNSADNALINEVNLGGGTTGAVTVDKIVANGNDAAPIADTGIDTLSVKSKTTTK